MDGLTVSFDTPQGADPPPDVPDYELLHQIGRGGCGQVYVARNRHHGEFCAVKVVFPDRTDVELAAIRLYKSIVKENDSLIQIQHVGKLVNGSYYYVMPLADDANGPAVLRAPDQYKPLTLDRYRLARGSLSIDDALSIVDFLLLGLKRLHTNTLVHCDVKPVNILRVEGKWRLGDLGLMAARELMGRPRGTRWFIPPESSLDFKADIYALGKTLFLLVTSARPPSLESERDPFDEFSQGDLDLPGTDNRKPALRQIILRACDRDCDHRYTTSAMHEAICKLQKTTSIVLKIVGVDYESLDEEQLVRDIAARLGLCIVSSKKRRGSVLLDLEVTQAQAEYLLAAVTAGELANLGVTEAWLPDPQKGVFPETLQGTTTAPRLLLHSGNPRPSEGVAPQGIDPGNTLPATDGRAVPAPAGTSEYQASVAFPRVKRLSSQFLSGLMTVSRRHLAIAAGILLLLLVVPAVIRGGKSVDAEALAQARLELERLRTELDQMTFEMDRQAKAEAEARHKIAEEAGNRNAQEKRIREENRLALLNIEDEEKRAALKQRQKQEQEKWDAETRANEVKLEKQLAELRLQVQESRRAQEALRQKQESTQVIIQQPPVIYYQPYHPRYYWPW